MSSLNPAASPGAPVAEAAAAPALVSRRPLLTWGLHAFLLLVGVGLIALYVDKLDAREALATLVGLSAGVLGLALVLYTLAWALRAWRLHLLSRAAGMPATVGGSLSTALGANALNLLAPARLGDVAAFLRLRGVAGSSGIAGAVLVQWRLTDLAGLLLVGLLGGVAVLLFGPPLGATLLWLVAAGAVVVAALAGAAVWAARRRSATVAGPGFLETLRTKVATKLLKDRADLGEGFGRTTTRLLSPGLLAGTVLLAVVAWLGDVAVAGVILHAAWGDPSAFLIVLVPVVAGNVAKMLPTTPGALGVFEGAFAASLLPFGVPLTAAITAAVATHLLMNAYTLVVGVPGAWSTARAVPRTLWQV